MKFKIIHLTLALVLIFSLAVLIVPASPFAGVVMAQSVTVTVPSTQPWTDTGLTVYPGDVISIIASGSISWDYTGVHVGPDGRYEANQGSCGYVVMDPTVPAQSLVCNIAPSWTLDGNGFFVGSSYTGTVPIPNTTSQSGKLFLGFNAGAVFCDRTGYDGWGFGGDNHGSFTATITITHTTECVATATGTGTACLTTSNGTIEDLEALPAIPPGAPSGIMFPHGMFSFKITGLELGQEVTVTIELPDPVPAHIRWWKEHMGAWYSVPVDVIGPNTITVTLTDGVFPGDSDKIEDGTIVDPGGPGNPGPVGWETHPVNKVRVLLPWIALVAAVAAGIAILARRRRAQS